MANSKFYHEEIYRGKDLIAKLSRCRLVILGVGALGSNLVDSLCRQGFSSIRIIDKDRVETHNLNTQVFGEPEIGALKAEAMKTRMFRQVGVEIDAFSKEFTAVNAKQVLKGADLVVDAFDNSASRQLAQDECRSRKIPLLHAGLFEDYGEVVWDETYRVPRDVEGDVCDYPLARNLVNLVVAITAEEILDFCLAKKLRKKSWTVTLKDLSIREMR